MALTEQDVREIVKDELSKLFSKFFGFNKSDRDIEFLPTSGAYKILGYTSQNELRTAVKNKILRVGKEVQDRRSSESKRPNYYFNIPACIKQLNTPPEKRKVN